MTYILMSNLNLSGDFVEGVVPPVVRELLGGIVAHSARVELQVGSNRFGDALIGLAEARA